MSGSLKIIKGQNPHAEAKLLHDHIVDCAQDLGSVSALMGAAMALCTLQIELTVEPSVEDAAHRSSVLRRAAAPGRAVSRGDSPLNIEKFLSFLNELPPHVGVRVRIRDALPCLKEEGRNIKYLQAEVASETDHICLVDGDSLHFTRVKP
jgi:hypothetical protein